MLGIYTHNDWGNPQAVELERRTRDWSITFGLIEAAEYFKAVVRQSATPSDGFFWALEWNRSVRVVGAIKCSPEAPLWLRNLPSLQWHSVSEGIAIRWEKKLSEDSDNLFRFEATEPLRQE